MTETAGGPPSTILNVDDNDDARDSLSWLLRANGFEVREASTGREALRMARARPDLIVLDVVLPDESGFDVCRRIKADPATASTPVLMLSGRAVSPVDRIQGLDGGADAYLTKPAEPALLIAHINALLRVRHAEQVRRRAAVVLETTADCFVAVDREWRYTYVNPQAERTLGVGGREVLGRPLWEVFPDAVGGIAYVECHRAMNDRVTVEYEEHYPFLGTWIEARAFPTDEGLAIVFRDVSARRRADEALRLRDRAMQAVSHGLVITDPLQPDNPTVYANPAFERLTGYVASEVIGRNCRFLQGPGTDPDAVARLRRAVAEGREWQEELLNYRKDGTTFWNHLSLTPVRDAGRVTHFVGIQTDATGRRRLEEQYRQAQKMEAVGQLAGGIAHDFNNLLTIIIGYGDMVLDLLSEDHPVAGLIGEMRKAGERAAGLTRQLLAFGRKAVIAPRVLDLNAVVRDVERMLRRLIGENIHVVVRFQQETCRAKIDPGQLEQVIVNLAVNARDAMPVGGRLTIETGEVDVSEGTAGVPPGEYVLLAVRDTGLGMTPDVLSRAFEPFFTTKGPGLGTGLGLATVHGIVEQSGGHVAVESHAGEGSAFRVYLPRVSAPPVPTSPAVEGTPLPRGTETILLAEDEGAVRMLGRVALAQVGYDVLEAASGEAALRVADARAGRIDLLVTDVVMPGIGGRALAERLLLLYPELKVLYLSGHTDDAVLRHGVREEQANFLQKPFGPNALARKVREVLDGSR